MLEIQVRKTYIGKTGLNKMTYACKSEMGLDLHVFKPAVVA